MDGLGQRGYQAFLAELSALDRFLAERAAESPGDASFDDPDVRRVLEAAAYFSARSQAALARGMDRAVQRIAGVPLEDLAALSPAAALVQFAPGRELETPVVLPAGTLLRVTIPAVPPATPERVSLFSTLDEVALRPMQLARVRLDADVRRVRLDVTLDARVPQSGAVEVALHVRRLGDYRASCVLFDALRRLARGARVRFDGSSEDAPVALAFGQAGGGPAAGGPIARVRSTLHLPEQGLVLRAALPERAGGWRTAHVEIELDEAWPADLRVDTTSLHLHVVAAHNRWGDLCAPLQYDGTRDALPLRLASNAREAAELVRVKGVFDADQGMRPVLPFALGLQPEGWEVLTADDGAPRLRVRLARALAKPAKIVVDAQWSQPALWESAPARVRVAPQQHAALKASLQVLGAVRRPEPSRFRETPDWTLDVVALRSRRALDRAELVTLLEASGASGESPFRGLPQQIAWVDMEDVVDGESSSGTFLRRVSLGWKRAAPEAAAVAREFSRVVAALLGALYETRVEVVSTIPEDGGET